MIDIFSFACGFLSGAVLLLMFFTFFGVEEITQPTERIDHGNP